MLVWRIVLLIVSAAIILQLDAYAYIFGVTKIRPWVYLLVILTLVAIKAVLSRRDLRRLASFQRDYWILVAGLAIYIAGQLFGLAGWLETSAQADAFRIYVFWVYLVALLVFGAVVGRELGAASSTFFFWILVIQAGLTVFDATTRDLSVSADVGRAAGTILNPNGAAFVAAVLMIGAIRWRQEAIRFREVAAVATATMVVLLSKSRGGILVLYAGYTGIALWWMLGGRSREEGLARTVAAVAGFMVAVTGAGAVLYVSRYGWGSHVSALLDYSGGERMKAAEQALALMGEHPLIGNGTGYVYTQELGPHNMFLRAWVEGGVIGVLAYSALLVSLLIFAAKRRDWGTTIVAIMVFMMGMTSHNVTENRSLWIVMGIMMANAGYHSLRRRARGPGRVRLDSSY